MKSYVGDNETTIIFVNKSAQTIKVYWLNYQGGRELYRSLAPGETEVRPTYLTHPWLITDENDNAWSVYFPDAQTRTVEITAPSPTTQPAATP